jgi:methyl-accepting chemotaxis protein
MKQSLTRVAGIALVIAGIGGILFSLIGLLAIARIAPHIEDTALDQLDLVDRALTATADGLAVIDTSLGEANTVVESVATMMGGVGQTVDDTLPIINTTAGFLGEDLPQTIGFAQETLRGAATSAQLIDDVLWAVTALPFLGTDRYNPEVPLHRGLIEVADSLDGLPAALGSVEEGLTAASNDLSGVGQDFAVMAGEIRQVTATVEDAQLVVRQYQDIVADVQALSSTVRESLPRWLSWVRWGLSLALLWLGIAQIGLVTQGWELIGRSRGGEAAHSDLSTTSRTPAGDDQASTSEEELHGR